MKKITVFYLALVAACFIFLILAEGVCHNQVFNANKIDGEARELVYQVVSHTQEAIVISGRLPKDRRGELTVAFFSVHQNIGVSINGEAVYEMNAKKNMLGQTPGIVWNYMNIKPEQMEGQIEIVLKSPYKHLADQVPELYVGSQLEILTDILEKDFPAIIICGFTFLMGAVLLIYWFIMKTKTKLNTNIFYLGMFAVMLGIWSISKLATIPVIVHNGIVISYLSYISLMLMPVPFILFMKELFQESTHPIWYLCCILSLTETVLCICLQIFSIADLRETLWITHAMYIIFIAVTFFAISYETKRGGISLEMKANIACMLLVTVGFLVDLGIYYENFGKTSVYGRACFLIYICILGYASTRDAAELLEKGREAEIYHKLAFIDALTGLHNRTAYSRNISAFTEEDLRRAQIFILDLNNLKWCNDNLGHMIGDNYILRASAIMSAAFPPPAKLYRIGGDEFCILTEGMSEESVSRIIDYINVPIQGVVEGKRFCGRISCGFAQYQESDADIYTIVRRADEEMYLCKRRNKEGENL